MSREIIRALGRIEGQLEGIKDQQEAHGEKLDAIDSRVRKVETTSAKHGMVSGGIAGVAVSLLAASIKAGLGSSGA